MEPGVHVSSSSGQGHSNKSLSYERSQAPCGHEFNRPNRVHLYPTEFSKPIQAAQLAQSDLAPVRPPLPSRFRHLRGAPFTKTMAAGSLGTERPSCFARRGGARSADQAEDTERSLLIPSRNQGLETRTLRRVSRRPVLPEIIPFILLLARLLGTELPCF